MPFGETTSQRLERIATEVVDAAYRVHSEMGPGLLESVYEACMEADLISRGLRVRRQVPVPISYRGMKLEEGFRVDLLVEECLVIEIKAVDQMNPVFAQQVKSYLRLLDLELGFLINFNVSVIKNGIKRVILSRATEAGPAELR